MDFADIQPLTGTVTDVEGKTWSGRIVYDMDEAWSRDVFNGEIRDLDYAIPFDLINSIEKIDNETCRVSLLTGRTLDLGGSQDTGDNHAGVLVFAEGKDEPLYIPWSRVGTITFRE